MLSDIAIPSIPPLPNLGIFDSVRSSFDVVVADTNEMFSSIAYSGLSDIAEAFSVLGDIISFVWGLLGPLEWVFYVGWFVLTALSIYKIMQGATAP